MFAEPPLDKLISGDSLAVLPRLPDACVDLVFADPPYNLQLQRELWRPNMTLVAGVNDAWDQFANLTAYDDFTRAWLNEVRRVMKDNATIWISGTYHNIFRVGTILQDLNFWILNTVSWFKRNGMPNFRGTRLKNDVEFVIWAKKSPASRYTFNHHQMKAFNEGKQLGSVWSIPACVGEERLRDSKGRKLHSTQKPEELLRRILLASSRPGDVVLDPFLGTGTTAAVAKQLHRHWIGIERESVYMKAAKKRVRDMQPLPVDDPLLASDPRHKRIPFRRLLEQGCLQPGQQLYLDRPQTAAVILPNGHVQTDEITGSIHRVGALLKNAPSCNGWTHWLYEDEVTGELRLIDELRARVRLENGV